MYCRIKALLCLREFSAGGRKGGSAMPEKSYHMQPEQFRECAHQAVDWIAEYYERIENLPVLSQVKPGDIQQTLPAQAPATGEKFAAILRDLDQVILPGVTHWQSPNFFAYFPANTSGPA